MAKPTKNQEMAQYFTFAYLNEANNRFAEQLDSLIERFEDQAEEREPNNIEKGLYQSLKDFRQYCRNAAEDINKGEKKSPNLQAASDEAARIIKGFATMQKNAPRAFDAYEDKYKEFTDGTVIKSGSQWIEEVKDLLDHKKTTPETAVAYIFAARQLSDAKRGDRTNIDKTLITSQMLDERAQLLARDPAFQDFVMSNQKKLGEMLTKIGTHDHGGKMEELLKNYALRNEDSLSWNDATMGRYKPDPEEQNKLLNPTAADLIKRSQDKLKDVYELPAFARPTLTTVAGEILAVRDLADNGKGSVGNLKKTHISETNWSQQSLNYYNTRVVSDFIDTLQNEADKAARDERANELAEINNLDPNDPRIQQEVKKVNGKLDLKLFTEKNGKGLEDKFAAYLKTRPDYAELDPKIYGRYLPKNLVSEFEVIEKEDVPQPEQKVEGEKPQYSGYGDYFTKNKENLDGTVSKIYHAAKMAAADDLRRNQPDNQFDRKVLENKAKTYLKSPAFRLVMRDEQLLDKVCRGDAQSLAMATDALKNALPEDLDDIAPSYDTFNKVKGIYELEEKRSNFDAGKLSPDVQEKVRDLSDKLNNIGKYFVDDPEKQYDTDKDPENLRGKIEKLTGSPLPQTVRKAKEEYVREGGPEYASLVKNVDKLTYSSSEQEDYLKAVNSILEYQDAHLSDKTGPHAQRVNDSMRLLCEITGGSGLEKYADQQIKRINEARGLQPGEPGFMKKSDFTEQIGGEENEIDGPEEDIGANDLDIFNKLKKFSFLNGNDDSMDEKDMEEGDKELNNNNGPEPVI